MSNFWNTSAGEKATGEVKENNFDPLPKGDYDCLIEEVKIKEYEGRRSVGIKARVVQEQYKNRVLFLSLKCFEFEGKDFKESARDRALNVLVRMYQVAKAKLPDGEPDDISLSQFTDKPMSLKLEVWDMNEKKGNWLVNIDSVGIKVKSKPAPNFSDMDDDIPF